MIRILIADKLDQTVVQDLQDKEGLEVDVKTGLSEDELAEIVGNYDGMIIRSGVKVTAKVLANVGSLRVIARAGVGVDNVDLEAATKAGVLVMNTPDANTISTAEHSFGMMLALARNICQACNDTKAGNWNRSKFVGRQLAGKQLGIIGLGRVGRAVAERALAFKMNVCGYDPLFTDENIFEGKVKLISDLDELVKTSDFITLHTPLTEKTRGMIGPERLAMMKPTAFIINCARGGLIDEQALAEAVKEKKIAGAAVDVFSKEPPEELELMKVDNIIVTCHLGASTKEAQLAVASDAAKGLLDYLQHGTIRSAVNVPGLPATLTTKDKAILDLVQRMAALLAPLAGSGIKSLQVTATSSKLENILPLLLRTALVHTLKGFFETSLNVINAELAAKTRNIQTAYSCKTTRESDAEHILIEVESADGRHNIEGRISTDGLPTILNIDGYRMQMVPEGIMVVLVNDDEPGAIGLVGTTFGEHKLNIADLTLSRREKKALMVFKTDEVPPDELLEKLRKTSPPIRMVAKVELPPIEGVRPVG